jgi:hypothetical protein
MTARTAAPNDPPTCWTILIALFASGTFSAAARGEVRPEKITPLIAALPGILIRHELFLSDATVSEAYLTEIVDDVLLPLVATGGPLASEGA